MDRTCHTPRQPLQTILPGTFEGGRRRDRQKKCWIENIKEWTSMLLTRASCRKDWIFPNPMGISCSCRRGNQHQRKSLVAVGFKNVIIGVDPKPILRSFFVSVSLPLSDTHTHARRNTQVPRTHVQSLQRVVGILHLTLLMKTSLCPVNCNDTFYLLAQLDQRFHRKTTRLVP